MALTRTDVRKYRDELDEALQEYGKKKGVQISVGHISFGTNDFTAKLHVVVAGSKDEAEKMLFAKNAELFGLEKDDYGLVIDMHGEDIKIVGLKPKSSKYPLIAEKNGKRYKYKLSDFVREQIKKARKK